MRPTHVLEGNLLYLKSIDLIILHEIIPWDFPDGPVVKNLLASAGTQVRSLVQEDSTYLGIKKVNNFRASDTSCVFTMKLAKIKKIKITLRLMNVL